MGAVASYSLCCAWLARLGHPSQQLHTRKPSNCMYQYWHLCRPCKATEIKAGCSITNIGLKYITHKIKEENHNPNKYAETRVLTTGLHEFSSPTNLWNRPATFFGVSMGRNSASIILVDRAASHKMFQITDAWLIVTLSNTAQRTYPQNLLNANIVVTAWYDRDQK